MARNKEVSSPDFDDDRSSRRHHDDDVPHPDDMPPDGTEDEGGSSVMDDVPEEPAPKKVRVARGKKGGITVKIDAPAAGNTADPLRSAPHVSPADPADEIQSMVDVDGVRPNLPKAIRGMLTLTREGVNFPTCADGVTPALVGWAGEIPDSPKYREDAIEKFGGGRYVVSGIGKDGKPKSFYLDLAGYSKPIPGTPTGVPQTPEVPGFSGMPGGLSGPDTPGIPVGNGIYQDPNTGEFIAGGDDQQTVEEWVWSTQRNMWVWTGRGRPPGRPPQGGPPNQQPAFNPSAYGADDDRIAKLEALVRDVAQGGGVSSMDRYLQMQQAQAEKEDMRRREEREREREEKKEERERERDMQERLREERKEEREREREEKKEEREREREERKISAQAAAEAAKAQAEAMKEIARIQASTAEANAKASVEAAREMAKMQAEASKTVMDIVLKKGNEGGLSGLLDQHVKLKNIFGGGESDKSEAERIMGMIPQLVDSVGPQLVNGVNAIRGKSVLGGATSSGDAGSGAVSDDDKIISAVDVVVKCRANNYPPDVAVRHLATSCIALEMDLNKVKGLILMTEQAPPAMIAANLDKAMQGRPEPAQKKIAGVKELLSNPAHAEWLKAFIHVLKGGQPAPTPAALPGGAQAPAPAKPSSPPAGPSAAPPAPPAGPRNGY